MASFNRVILVGNLTRDPELRHISTGTAVSEIGLAVNDRVKKNGEWVDETTFVDITLWARTAEVANEYLSKGSSILIEGRLKLDQWEKDGQKRSKLRVVADRMQMLGGRDGGGNRGGSSGGRSQSAPSSQSSGGYDDGGYDDYEGGGGGNSYSDAAASTPSAPPNDDIPF